MEQDERKAAALYQEANGIIMNEDAGYAPLFDYFQPVVLHPSVKGFSHRSEWWYNMSSEIPLAVAPELRRASRKLVAVAAAVRHRRRLPVLHPHRRISQLEAAPNGCRDIKREMLWRAACRWTMRLST
jgi:hypothetical protein